GQARTASGNAIAPGSVAFGDRRCVLRAGRHRGAAASGL
ncbi:MAG: hypothetical protein AVDCRST_MAG23-634, partial [uncultured Sphingosinicella sp.]